MGLQLGADVAQRCAGALSAPGSWSRACIVASSSSAARSESLGSDAAGIVAGCDELARDRLDEAAGAADVGPRVFIGRPRRIAKQLAADAPTMSCPVLGPRARESHARGDA